MRETVFPFTPRQAMTHTIAAISGLVAGVLLTLIV